MKILLVSQEYPPETGWESAEITERSVCVPLRRGA
jgi:hypothetical protein